MIKIKDKRIVKIYAIVLVTAIVLMGIASYAVFNKPATAQVAGGSAVSLSLSEKALDKILAVLGLNVPESEMAVGVASGPDKYNMQNFFSSYTSGGNSFNASSTLTAARSITATEFCNNSYIHVNSAAVPETITASSLDITFPATSTLFAACLSYPGAEKVITFRNNSPTTASTTELVAGIGCDMRVSEATGADNDIEGLNEARITIRRTDDAFADGGSVDCIILVEETIVD